MGAYPVSSNGYQNYGYQTQWGATTENPAEGSGSLLSNDDPLANDIPLTGANDNRVLSDKEIKKQYEDVLKALRPKKRGFFQKIGDFFKGVGNGIKNIFKSLADPKNWLLIGGAIALCIVCPPAGAVLAGVGAVMAGSQMIKGVSSGNWEQVGEGTLNLGLSVAGFKGATAGVKTGGAKFTLSGTRTAESSANLAKAEEELNILKKAGADAEEIQKAELAVAKGKQAQQVAMENQARIETARMNFWNKTNFLQETETADLSVAQVQVRVMQSTDDLNVARAQASDAQLTLKEAEAFGDDSLIAEAEANNMAAQRTLVKATQTNLDMLKAERIKQLQNMRHAQRAKTYAQDYWATTQDSLGTIRGKTLTSMDGRTVTYWKRTPKGPHGEVLVTAPSNQSMSSIFKNWWTPDSKDKQATEAELQGSGISMPKGGSPNLPPNNDPSGQNSKQAVAAAKAAKEAIIEKWQAWRESQKLKAMGDTAWDNKYNAVVPVSEFNQRKQDKKDADDLDNNILAFDSGSQANPLTLELPA